MLIPWDKLQENGVIELQDTETVVELRDRLEALGGSAQHLSALVVHLPDGRAVPSVVAQVKELAKRYGRRILGMRLQELADELCPQPWEMAGEPPDYRQAEMAVFQRRLPVIVTKDGQREGIIRQPRREVISQKKRGGGDFDLFDRSIPERDQAVFVWIPADATLIHVARTLAPFRENPRVYVIREIEQGKYGVALKAELNAALQRLAGETKLASDSFWALPLDHLEDSFQLAQLRDVEDVSGNQAVDLSASKHLILLHSGVPDILYPRRILHGGAGGRGGVNFDSVSLSGLQHVSSTVKLAVPKTEPRYVNLWFEDIKQESVPYSDALELGRIYNLTLNVGALREMSIIDWAQAPGGAKAIVEPQEKDAYLYVSVFSEDFEVPEPTQALKLPQEGDTAPLRFQVVPLRRTRLNESAKLEVCLYYRAYLVQTFEVEAEIVAAGEVKRSDEPQTTRLVHARTTSFPAMEKLPTRDLSLTITRDGSDRYRFTFLLDPDPDDPGAAEEAIKLACHVDLTRDELTHLITKARRQLYNVVRVYRLIQKQDQEACSKALQALAQVGRQLYRKLFRTDAAEVLHQWMQKHVPPGSTIQIVDRGGDFVFPWSLIYEGKPWGQQIDVKQFWGWRYKLAISTDTLTHTYGVATEQIETAEELKILVGLYARLHGAREQNQYFKQLADSPDRKVGLSFANSGSTAVQALQAADQHLIYFFCHGYTEKMATDIQLDDDLVRQFTEIAVGEMEALAGQSEDEQEASLREHLSDLFDVSDSWMRLTRGKLPLTMLEEELERVTFSAHPLVFLNMCQSAQVLPSLSGGLIPFFINKGARAVIGTECSMNMIFGDRFSQDFWDRFLKGQPAAEVIWELRRKSLEQGDPLGLAYTLFGDADLKLAPIRKTGEE